MKRLLTLSLVVLGIIGIFVVSKILTASMQPSEKAKGARSHHNIGSLNNGQFIIEMFGRDSAWNEKVLIIKDWDSNIYTYLLPTENGKITMPDRWWGWGYYHCSEFHPETDSNGYLKKGGIIKCHDKSIPEWGASQWEWSYNGNPVDKWGIKMYSPQTEIVNGVLYINK